MQAQGKWSAGEGDDKERFLADLRALRDTAALEFDELAARAHYPSNVLEEAESGPSLPGLPILAAYVRACEGDVPEWEERWRRFGLESHADPGLPVRPAGASPAAVAGARAGVSVAPPDAYDPERIRAALRGSRGPLDRGAHGQPAPERSEPDSAIPAAAESRVPESPASWSAGTSWDETTRWDPDAQPGTGWDGLQPDAGERWDGVAADLSGTPANGNHHVSQPDDGSSGTAVIAAPDADRADAIRRDPFSSAWIQDGEAAQAPDGESPGPDRPEAGSPAADPDSWFTPREPADREQARADTEPPAAAADTWFTPRERADEGAPTKPAPPHEHAEPAAARVTGFWTPSASDRTMPIVAQKAAAATPRTIAGPTVPPGPVVPPSERSGRLYPVRLLMIIVVAALVGSVLVLLMR